MKPDLSIPRLPHKALDLGVFRCKLSLLNQSYMIYTRVITALGPLSQVSQIADT